MQSCAACGKTLVQKRFSSGVLESPSMLNRRKYCDRRCMAIGQQKEVCQSLSHSRGKAHNLAKAACQLCGKTGRLHVHHVDENPQNNAESNLKTLCPSCHRRAHSPNWTADGAKRANCEHCSKASIKRGLCGTHLSRLKRFGHPLGKKRKVGSEWVLMLHDGKSWSPFPLPVTPLPEWDACAPTVTPSSRKSPKK